MFFALSLPNSLSPRDIDRTGQLRTEASSGDFFYLFFLAQNRSGSALSFSTRWAPVPYVTSWKHSYVFLPAVEFFPTSHSRAFFCAHERFF